MIFYVISTCISFCIINAYLAFRGSDIIQSTVRSVLLSAIWPLAFVAFFSWKIGNLIGGE